MGGYSGRVFSLDTNSVVARRVHNAATGPQTTMWALLDMIGTYIANTAIEDYDGHTTRVPCPTATDWARLSSGRSAVLPPESKLMLYASDKMRKVIAKIGLREAYFRVALSRLGHQQNKSG